jgi:hypothetical protein
MAAIRRPRIIREEKRPLAERRQVKIGQFGGSGLPVVNTHPSAANPDMGVSTTGIHAKQFDEVQEKVQERERDPKANISVGLAGLISSKDPLAKKLAPVKEAMETLQKQRTAEKVAKRSPEQHLVDEAKAEAAEIEDQIGDASVRMQMKKEFGVRPGKTKIEVTNTVPEIAKIRAETVRLMQEGALSREDAAGILLQSLPEETVDAVMEGIPG